MRILNVLRFFNLIWLSFLRVLLSPRLIILFGKEYLFNYNRYKKRQLNFEFLKSINRLEIRTNLNQLVKEVTNPQIIAAVLIYLNQHYDKWYISMWEGANPSIDINFYVDRKTIGTLGIGKNFLCTSNEEFLYRNIKQKERIQILQILGLEAFR